jgi:hypothetical protein
VLPCRAIPRAPSPATTPPRRRPTPCVAPYLSGLRQAVPPSEPARSLRRAIPKPKCRRLFVSRFIGASLHPFSSPHSSSPHYEQETAAPLKSSMKTRQRPHELPGHLSISILPLSIKGNRRPLLSSSPTQARLSLSSSPRSPSLVHCSSPEFTGARPARARPTSRTPARFSCSTDLLAEPSPSPCASENQG